jgi:hypothetical protein
MKMTPYDVDTTFREEFHLVETDPDVSQTKGDENTHIEHHWRGATDVARWSQSIKP